MSSAAWTPTAEPTTRPRSTAPGRLLGDAEFAATAAGYAALLAWLRRVRPASEGRRGGHRYLRRRPGPLPRHAQRRGGRGRPPRPQDPPPKGKSDPIDAIAAARAVLAGTATGAPKTRTGPVEAIRALRVARRGAVKARTAALNQLHGLLTSAPEPLRAELAALSQCRTGWPLRRLPNRPRPAARAGEATKAALRAIARRIQALEEEIALADTRLRPATATGRPEPWRCSASGPTWPGSCWSPPGTTRPAAQRGRAGPPGRDQPTTGQLRAHRPTPPQPRR